MSRGQAIGQLPWKAFIRVHAGATDTVAIHDADGNEIVHWAGFDGVPGTKAQIRARARQIVKAVNSAALRQSGAERGETA